MRVRRKKIGSSLLRVLVETSPEIITLKSNALRIYSGVELAFICVGKLFLNSLQNCIAVALPVTNISETFFFTRAVGGGKAGGEGGRG